MGLSFKVAPGVRIRASSRGLSAGVGPRAARVHVGTRGVGVSSGVGPISGYTHLGGGAQRRSGGGGRSYGPTKASVAAYERELRQAQRETDIEKVQALERSLVSVHEQTFSPARRIELPAPPEVEPAPIRNQLETEAEVPRLEAAAGGGMAAPVAPEPAPVDRYALMREHRKRARQGISIFKLRDQIAAARLADREAEDAAVVEEERRAETRREEQRRLDALWAELVAAREKVAAQLPGEVAAEAERRAAERARQQAGLDAEWARLTANEPLTTLEVLEQAFADNDAPAAPLNCEGGRTTVAMRFPQPAEVVPERKPALTPGGKQTLKKRTKTEINALYLEALGSNVLATVKEAFAVAPGTAVVQVLVIRREIDKKHAGELAVIYAGEFDRESYVGGRAGKPGTALTGACEAAINLKGKTAQVAPIDLSERPDVAAVLEQVAGGLDGSSPANGRDPEGLDG